MGNTSRQTADFYVMKYSMLRIEPYVFTKERYNMTGNRTLLVNRLILLLLVLCGGAPAMATDTDYALKPGDILTVSVWKEQDLAQEVLVRPDGKFSFPLAGDIDARGRSVEQVRGEIVKRLEKYIPDPVVAVAVKQIQGNKLYVLGKVSRPGEFIMNSDTDVMQALSMAGGTTTFAGLNRIKILRRVDGKQIAIPFHYADVEDGEHLEQNIILQSGDVVVVP